MRDLRHLKLDFKSFSTTYYMPNSDNRARNDDRLKLALISNIQSCATRPRYGRIKCATGPLYDRVKCATGP